MCVDGHDDGFDRHSIHHPLKGVTLPVELVVLLDLEELTPLGVVLNLGIEELGPLDAPAFEVLDLGGEMHFGLGENKREETVLASLFGGNEMARKLRGLVDKVSN